MVRRPVPALLLVAVLLVAALLAGCTGGRAPGPDSGSAADDTGMPPAPSAHVVDTVAPRSPGAVLRRGPGAVVESPPGTVVDTLPAPSDASNDARFLSYLAAHGLPVTAPAELVGVARQSCDALYQGTATPSGLVDLDVTAGLTLQQASTLIAGSVQFFCPGFRSQLPL